MHTITKIIAPLLILALTPAVQAEWRCDCTTVVASCDAQVAVKGNWVEITTDQQACARVDYFIDGLPFVALVVDGDDRQDWISQTDEPNVMVQSCQVCADKLTEQPIGSMETPARPAPPDGDERVTPLIQIDPKYPASAQARGLEGYVVVEFKVTPFGTVEQAQVVEAQPPQVFDQVALAAITRWRYPQVMDDEAQRVLRERLDFRVNDFIWTEPAPSSRQVAAATRPVSSGPQNECVKQRIAYNFGEVIEIGLINACINPVVLFSCAVGTGKDQGRWRCGNHGQRTVVLVRRGDQRSGHRANDSVSNQYAEDHFVMRAPNTEYWWIACNEGDLDCHVAGRDWSAGLDGRPATVNPAQVARVRVARSF